MFFKKLKSKYFSGQNLAKLLHQKNKKKETMAPTMLKHNRSSEPKDR
jgi:hypothetical protein